MVNLFGSKKSGQQTGSQDTSNIVLSFNNANGGHLFAHWLRNELMKKLNYFSQNSIYLDNVAVRHVGGTGKTIHHSGLKWSKERGLDEDDRYVKAMKNGLSLVGYYKGGGSNYATIGAMHRDWEKMWTQALKSAKVLIQIQTEDYARESKKEGSPCARELAKIRLAAGNKKILVLALRFNDLPNVAVDLEGGTHVIPMYCNKINYGGGADIDQQTGARIQTDVFQGAYKISESELSRIAAFCKFNGC